jgi:hypothetical protein
VEVDPLRVSRCTVPQDPKLIWHWHFESGVNLIKEEIAAFLETISDTGQKKLWWVEIQDRLEDAARGLLPDEKKTIRPIRAQPEIWEIKWETEFIHLRLYEAEPRSDLGVLRALRFHEKWVGGTSLENKRAQDAHIGVAASRHTFS